MTNARDDQRNMLPALEIFAAAEGQSLELRGRDRAVTSNESTLLNTPALATPLLLMAVKDPAAANSVREAAQADGITVLELGGVTEALNIAQSVQPSLVILEWEQGDVDAVEGHKWMDVPILFVADEETVHAEKAATDWLIRPFSTAYARTRIRACLLRTACRGERVLTSQNEQQRCAQAHD